MRHSKADKGAEEKKVPGGEIFHAAELRTHSRSGDLPKKGKERRSERGET